MTIAAPPLGYLVSRYPAISHTFILREVSRLRALGHTIFTASINPPDRALQKMDAAERREAEATYCVKADGARGAAAALAWWTLRAPLTLARTIGSALRMGRGLRGIGYAAEAAMVARWMQSHGLAHLHVHFGNAGAAVGVLVKQLTACHLSYTIHGPDEFDDVPGQRLTEKMRAADVVVCISQFARSQLMRISDAADWPKFRVCRLGVDPRSFRYTPPRDTRGPVRLLCVGRLAPAKAQLLLVEACAALRQRGIDFMLTLVGDGPDRGRIEEAIDRLALNDCVELTGALTVDGVRRALARADVFVLPSFAEGIPVVLMEAMASGVPCVSTRVNGIPELIEHGRTGLLTAAGDVDGLADQLERLADDPGLRSALAHEARAEIEARYDLDTNVQRLSDQFAAFPASTPTTATASPRTALAHG